MLIKRESSVQSYCEVFHHTGEWNGCFANRKVVNRHTLPPKWRTAENYLRVLLIKLQFVFHHPLEKKKKSHDSKTQHLLSHSAHTHVLSVIMSAAMSIHEETRLPKTCFVQEGWPVSNRNTWLKTTKQQNNNNNNNFKSRSLF